MMRIIETVLLLAQPKLVFAACEDAFGLSDGDCPFGIQLLK